MEKWERRDRKLAKRRSTDMVVSNRSLKSVILPTIAKKAQACPACDRRREKKMFSVEESK